MSAQRVMSMIVACGLLIGASAAPVQGKKPEKTPRWGGADSPLRPGASFAGKCTFNFVFYQPGTKGNGPIGYIGTAAHCTDKLGEIATNRDVGEIGEVVYDSDLVDSGVDFSLIELNAEVIPQTNPEVLGWGGPTRSISHEDLALGDRVNVYGYGVGVGLTEQTRPRYGFLTGYNEQEYQADMPAVNGDSGAPLIHHETGAALGIISRYGITVPPSTDLGPLMPWIFEELKAAGFRDVKLATVAG